jgi:hypothetical protein
MGNAKDVLRMKLGLTINVFVNYGILGLTVFVYNAVPMLILMAKSVFVLDCLKEMDSNAYKLKKRKHLCLHYQDHSVESLAI